MPVCGICGCRKNLHWYTYCKHCGEALAHVSPSLFRTPSGVWSDSNKNGNGKRGGYSKQQWGHWRSSATTTAVQFLSGSELQPLVDMPKTKFEAASLFMLAAQKKELLNCRAPRMGDPEVVSRVAQQQHTDVRSKLASTRVRLGNAEKVMSEQFDKVCGPKALCQQLGGQGQQLARYSAKAWSK
eukprot:6348507-Pyramimonas_sp.AAC.1